ncbi:MAG: hypothetical protein NTZ35_18625 [Ignavibacteriales bacterium]|nr:hypothetical protein [Ignavibacteriales bacterium]
MNPADYSILVMSLSLAAYGVYQYVKREKEHRALLQTISKSVTPNSYAAVDMIKHASWRLIALALGEVLLIAHLIWRVSTIPDPAGVGKLMGFVVTTYLMLALPGVLGVLKRALWHLMTLCFIEAVLVAAIIWLIYIRSKIIYAGEVTYFIAFFFVVLFLVLLPMVVRDIRAYRNK